MTKEEIAKNLYEMAIDMAILSYHMKRSCDNEIVKHGIELEGAACIANEWSYEIKIELESEHD